MSDEPKGIACPYCGDTVVVPFPWTPRKCDACDDATMSSMGRPQRPFNGQRGSWRPAGAEARKQRYDRKRN